MLQVNVLIHYQGNNYQTNVIANRETSEEDIMRIAFEQIKKQWLL